MKKNFVLRSALMALSLVLLLATVAIGASADETATFFTYQDGELVFTSYTEGAEKAFDGDETTGFDGSITGMFEKPTMVTGVTVKAVDTVKDVTVKVSADGVNWNTIYEVNKVTKKLSAEFGSAGPEVKVTSTMRGEMYTYVVKYVRVETGAGEISELQVFGYAVDVTGIEIAPDTTYETNGYKVSLSNYEVSKLEFCYDHNLGSSWEQGEVVKPQGVDADPTLTSYIETKLEKATVLTEVVIGLRADCNKENIGNRFNNIHLEASVDGSTWTTLLTTPEDYYTKTDMANNINVSHVWKVTDTTAYQYVRIRSDIASGGKGWLTLSELNVYGKGEVATAPANVLKGWEGDPHVVETPVTVAPTEEVTEPAPQPEATQPQQATTTTTESNGTQTTEKKGCGASITGGALALIAILGCGVAVLTKKD